jgi:hypothetical protein
MAKKTTDSEDAKSTKRERAIANGEAVPVRTTCAKFLKPEDDGACTGHRGVLVALNLDDKAHELLLFLGATGELWGKLCLCEVRKRNEHPYMLTQVDGVPADQGWEIVLKD